MRRQVAAALLALSGCSRAPERAPDATEAAAPTAAPTLSPMASAPPSASAAPVASIAPAAPAPPAPPAVDVRAIGMHIGGGPNDDANKAPLLASLALHHDALARCWGALPGRPRVELGVDAHVPGKGGRAKIEHPRSTVKDDAFVACAVAVFERIDFLPPKSGIDTTVSASVRLTPRAGGL